MRMQGTVRLWTDKGYGFITADDGQELFGHIRSVMGDFEFDELLKGTRVEFDTGPSRRHPGKLDATQIRVLSEPA
jgi:cold shock CspA family protein